jgi:predicted dehydrogenase
MVRTASQIGHALRARKSGGDYVASYQAQWAHFLGAVRTGGELRCSVDDGYEAVVAALAARRSAAEDGRRIALIDIDQENIQT